MSKECVEQVEGAGASVPMTDISNIDVPEGTDELSRNTRRAWRDRLNSASTRKMITGVLATLVGGSFWGFSGTSASFLFDTYHVDTLWLMSVRQILAGLLFMAVVVTRDRARLVKLWTTPADRKQLLLFTAFGLLFNQFCYLSAVRLTNAGTATVLQCLQLVIIMGYACVTDRRMPRTREVIGIGLALGGTFLIATGGDPTSLNISPLGLAAGLMCAVSAACMAVIPAKILPEYGSPIVTGSAMLTAGALVMVAESTRHTAIGHAFFAYMLYMQGVKDIGSVRASLIGTVEPVSATITSAVMLGTVFLPTDLIGFVMIIVMMFLTV